MPTRRAVELVVCTVTDEHRLERLDAERVAAREVDPRIGFENRPATKDLGVEEPGGLRFLPERFHVLRADGDQPDELAALRSAEGLDDTGAWLE